MLHLPVMTLGFSKYEGIGNDFVVIDERAYEALGPAEARRICDRHLGVGGDGVLLVGERAGRPSMKVINADGSIPEMCGNGLRCVALHLVRAGRAKPGVVVIETDAGPHRCDVEAPGDVRAPFAEASVEVAMCAPSFAPDSLPFTAGAPLVEGRFDVDGEALVAATAVSMGNPHLVLFDDVGERRAHLGPRIERDPRFPQGVNVGFARLTGAEVVLDVWERGAGWTRACGTGACAAVAAAVETGRAERGAKVAVRLPGGVLEITVGAEGEPVRMRGPARHVFDGELSMAYVRGAA
jgi:diaminopimelate epimerase